MPQAAPRRSSQQTLLFTLFMCTGCRRKPSGKQLPGPKFPVPLVGAVVEMVLDPFKFWEQQRKWVQSVLGEAAKPACRPCTPLPAPAIVKCKTHTCSACRLSFPGLSCNTLLGKFMVFITDPDSCRTALSVNSPDSLLMAVHPSGKVLLLPAIPPCSPLNTGTNKQPSFFLIRSFVQALQSLATCCVTQPMQSQVVLQGLCTGLACLVTGS